MLGTAWPAMRQTFGSPVGALGLVLLVATVGSVLVTAVVGRLIRRLGVAALLATSGGCAAVAAAGFAAAPGLWTVLGVAVLSGAAAGMMDGGLNTDIGLSGRRRLLNLLHGAYGVGTAIGPLLVTAALLIGSWRGAYGVLLLVDVAVAVLWLVARAREGAPGWGGHPSGGVPAGTAAGPGGGGAGSAAPGEPVDGAATAVTHGALGAGSARFEARSPRGRRAAIAAGIGAFFVYTGLEVGAGQWETTFCRGELHMSAAAAGLAAFGYWGALTAVRIGLAVVPRPVDPRRVVAVGSAVAVVATLAVWWQPDRAVTLAGFVVLGAALAGIFPSLVALTPHRIGRRRAETVIAWQVGGAAAGGAGLSAVIGLLLGSIGLGALGPAVTVLAVLLAVVLIALERMAPSAG